MIVKAEPVKKIRLPGMFVEFTEDELTRPCPACGSNELRVYKRRLECIGCDPRLYVVEGEPIQWPAPAPDFVGCVNKATRKFYPSRKAVA